MGKKEMIKGVLLRAYSVPFYLTFLMLPEFIFRKMYPNVKWKTEWTGHPIVNLKIGPRIIYRYYTDKFGKFRIKTNFYEAIGKFIFSQACLYENIYWKWFFGSMKSA